MRGGLIRDHVPPYTEHDLKQEFGQTHILVRTGSEYTACPVGDPGAEPVRAASASELAGKLRAPAGDGRPAYTATDLFAECGQRWHIFWETYLDGRFLVAVERLAQNPAHYVRRTPADLRDVLAEHEASRPHRGMITG